jgi:DNA mismatch endonuclease (patch repair protein)
MMSGIRGRDTKPEVIVRKYLHAHGLRYRIAPKNLPGKPDIVLPKYRTVVFVHGCFWHRHPGCRYTAVPTSNAEFWKDKFDANVKRDALAQKTLRAAGWRVCIIWECQITPRKLSWLAGTLINHAPRGPRADSRQGS